MELSAVFFLFLGLISSCTTNLWLKHHRNSLFPLSLFSHFGIKVLPSLYFVYLDCKYMAKWTSQQTLG